MLKANVPFLSLTPNGSMMHTTISSKLMGSLSMTISCWWVNFWSQICSAKMGYKIIYSPLLSSSPSLSVSPPTMSTSSIISFSYCWQRQLVDADCTTAINISEQQFLVRVKDSLWSSNKTQFLIASLYCQIQLPSSSRCATWLHQLVSNDIFLPSLSSHSGVSKTSALNC